MNRRPLTLALISPYDEALPSNRVPRWDKKSL